MTHQQCKVDVFAVRVFFPPEYTRFQHVKATFELRAAALINHTLRKNGVHGYSVIQTMPGIKRRSFPKKRHFAVFFDGVEITTAMRSQLCQSEISPPLCEDEEDDSSSEGLVLEDNAGCIKLPRVCSDPALQEFLDMIRSGECLL